jgi:hypothetical protein
MGLMNWSMSCQAHSPQNYDVDKSLQMQKPVKGGTALAEGEAAMLDVI